ncbi:hypothetical protein BCR36DRAFT_369650 [Piromyces finnis]|uniref:Uncharacterized protein n=1 Tax=Piromyces finnis TaxID=1754191 RepID=A0A1Y1VD01_9FUNG|nr:hypothetical protein BCR36DRAFT_369650 [Piromyces finnis]|eukprot:ORX51737.1 hypothetical protein BCR36DRAFT_369650 [Piromyces finnis]
MESFPEEILKSSNLKAFHMNKNSNLKIDFYKFKNTIDGCTFDIDIDCYQYEKCSAIYTDPEKKKRKRPIYNANEIAISPIENINNNNNNNNNSNNNDFNNNFENNYNSL